MLPNDEETRARWPMGKSRQREIRYPVVKKGFSRSQKQPKPAA
ncbi:MAG TPA: hypothetical protein V6D15_16570 [Oculatellaceae cyanobacterium]